MNRLEVAADLVEIEALRGEIVDAATARDYDRFASLFTVDGAWRMPHIATEFVSREVIRAGVERMLGQWEYFVQTAHPGTVRLDGDIASGRAYLQELGRLKDGRSGLNFGVYHDRYRRTAEGWRFVERVYEMQYVDMSTLAGTAPAASAALDLRV